MGVALSLIAGLGLGYGVAQSVEVTPEASATPLGEIPELCVQSDVPDVVAEDEAVATATPSVSTTPEATSDPRPDPTSEPTPSTEVTPSASPSRSATESPTAATPEEVPTADPTTVDDEPLTSRAATLDDSGAQDQATETQTPESDASESEAPATTNPEPSATDEPSATPSPSASDDESSNGIVDEGDDAEPSEAEEEENPLDTTPRECPTAVVDVTAQPGDNQVTVGWDPGSDNTATSYFVVIESESRFVEVLAPATTTTISGLRNGVSYSFAVIAAHAGGSAVPSARVTATPTNGMEGEVAGLLVSFANGGAVAGNQESVPGEEEVTSVDLSVENKVSDDVHVVEFSEPLSVDEASAVAQELASSPEVAWAEPDLFVSSASDVVIDDAEFDARQWNLWDTYGVGVADGSDQVRDAFTETLGEGSTVAVIDTGITEHPDLEGQLVPGFDFVSNPENLAGQRAVEGPEVPFDADYEDTARFGGLGWDDNPTDPGDWNQVAPIRDSSWHGTHVAGIIAAKEGNAVGVVGIAPRAKIQPVRALSWRGGLMSDIAASITWASGGTIEGAVANSTPANVITMAFAMEGMCPNSLQSAIDDATERGAVLIAAAGNANDDVSKYAPANCESVITVGATGRDGKRAPYSNYGAGIDVSAPGGSGASDGGVVSTSNTGTTSIAEPSYVGREGTSIAAAHVAAIAARVMGADATATPELVRSLLIGRDSVREFADGQCDADPSKTCGSGIAQIASADGLAGVQMNLSVGGSLIADGSTVANGSSVITGTSALLTPGTAQRVLRTSLDPSVEMQSGSAVAPEGWSIEYSTNNGSTWASTQPTASSVTDIRASANVSAGLIEGTSQVYSSETTSAIPSSTFLANAGGDGYDVFFYEDQVYNIFHHLDDTVIMCHIKSTSQRCPGFSSAYTIPGFGASMRSTGWIDGATGKLYAFGIKSNHAWVVCLDVSTSTPTRCGETQVSTLAEIPNYRYLSEGVAGSGRMFAVETAGTPSLLCFDVASGARCPNSPITLTGLASNGDWSQSLSRPAYLDGKIFATTDQFLYCFEPGNLTACTGSWPVAISPWRNGYMAMGLAPHVNSSQQLDGVCYYKGTSEADSKSCLNLDGTPNSTWKSPFILGVPAHPHITMGVETIGRFYYGSGQYVVGCWDYSTNAKCTNFGSSGYKTFSTDVGIVYAVTVDPQNPACLWVNTDRGYIYNFDAYTGQNGCSSNPVITLQPSQFAPRYACSTTSGITEWTELRLVSLSGGGSASSIGLTVRNASGGIVSGWSNRSVTLGTPLDMTGLDVSQSGSRPTFSFAFSNVTGTISTAVIALDYKGKGPELCVTTVTSADSTPTNVSLEGTLTETFLAEETFTSTRTFTIGTTSETITQSAPSAPLSVTGSGINTTATITFEAPLSDGNSTITGYQVSSDGGSSWSDATVTDNGDGTFSTRISGLSVGQTYTFNVAAVNAIGRGTAGSASITIQRSRTESLVDTALNRGPVTLEPDTVQGLPLTYTTSTPSVCSVSSNVVTLVAEGTCTLRAQNGGDPNANPPIAAVDVTGSFTVTAPEPELPGAPTALAVTRQNGQVTLSWTAPTFTGYTSITDYIVQYKSGSSWTIYSDGTSNSTSTVIAGLTNGTVYDFRVAAVNSVGTGSFTSSASGTPATVPGAATSLSASRSGTSATLTWTAPSSTGGTAITDYQVEYKLSEDPSWTTFVDGVASTTGATITGLSSGSSYDFRVSALNGIGAGPYTSTANLTATARNAEVALTWTQPTFTGGEVLSYYVVQVRETGTSTWSDSGTSTTSTSRTVTGLTNGTTYDFRVAAVTTTSTSSYTSVATDTPRTTPGLITDLTATPGNRQVLLSWTAPNNGGSAITDYAIQFKSTNGSWATVTDGVSTQTSFSVTSLSNGSAFDFRVAAINVAGTGGYSSEVASTPRTTPGAPTDLSRTLGDGEMTLGWTAPTSTGGSAITDYSVQYRVSGVGPWRTFSDPVSTTTSATITGLTNGVTYEVRIAAVNAAGTGTESTAISGTPRTRPGAPRNLTATKELSSIDLSWSAPLTDGGSSVTDYRIEYREAGTRSWVTLSDMVSTSATWSDTTLDLANDYEFRVYAINVVGESPASNSATTEEVVAEDPASGQPTTQAPVLAPVDPQRGENIAPIDPPRLKEDSAGAVMIDGVLVDITITPFTGSGGAPTWAVRGPDFSVDFQPQPTGSSGSLSGPSQGLRSTPGSWVSVSGDGYLSESRVKAYLILRSPVVRSALVLHARASDVIYLGEVNVRADGTFDIRVVVPESVPVGDYVLQINGLSTQNKMRSVNMALGVDKPSMSEVGLRSIQRKAFFKPRSADFSKLGQRKLQALVSSVDPNSRNIVVNITGVSVSLSTLRENLDLAARRAERVAEFLQLHNIVGEYKVSVNTNMKIGPADRLAPTEKRNYKPLTTVTLEMSR